MMTSEEKMLRLKLGGAIAIAIIAGVLLAYGLIDSKEWAAVVGLFAQ